MRPLARVLLAAALVSALAACTPQAPRVARVAIGLRDVAAVIPGVTALELDVVGPEMPPVHASLPTDGSTAVVEVPAGPARVFLLRAFAAGVLTHQGSTTADLVAGREQTITIRLEPVDTGIPPPAILSRIPTDGATGVASTTVVTVTFSEAIDPATVDSASFTLVDAASTPVPATVSVAGAVATLTPDAPLAPLTAHTAAIAGVRALAGSDATAPSSWSFTTAALPDTTPPAVISTAPAAGAVDVPVDTPVSVAFTEAVDPATVDAASFTLTGPGGPVIASSISASGPTATFVPASLAAGTTYTAALTIAVTDLAGNGLAAPVSWTFTTAAAGGGGFQCAAPEALHDGEVFAVHATPVGPGGDLLVIGKLRTDASAVWARRYRAGSGWAPPEILSDPANPDTSNPVALRGTEQGDAVAAWMHFGTSGVHAWARRFDGATGTWAGTPLLVQGGTCPPYPCTGARQVTELTAAMDGNGDATVLWIEEAVAGASYEVFARRWTRAGGLDPAPTLLSTATEVAFDLRAGAGFGGTVVAAWNTFGTMRTRAWRGSAWNVVESFAGREVEAIAVADDGAAMTIWEDGFGAVNVARSGPGPDDWGPVRQLSPSGNWPLVVSDGQGRVVASWADRASRGEVAAAFDPSVATGTPPGWTDPLAIDLADANNITWLVGNRSGDVLFGENRLDATERTTASVRAYRPATGWNSEGIVDVGDPSASQILALAMDPLGRSTVFWGVRGTGIPMASRCDFGPDAVPPGVTALSPAPDATDVPTGAIVTATFSELVDPATVDAASFTLAGPGGSAVPASVTASGNRATLTPAALAAGTTYTATLTTQIADLAGNPLTSPVFWSFTTGAAADTTPPAVISTVPVDGATGVSPAALVVASFSEPVDPATVSAATFTLAGPAGAVAPLSVALSPDGLSATFTPVALAPGALYAATVTTGVRDLAGNPMTADTSWSFTTAAAPTGWEAAIVLDPSAGGDGTGARVAADDSGDAVAVWTQYEGAEVNVRANRYLAGSGWGTSQVLDAGPGPISPPTLSLAANGAGQATAVWSQQDASGQYRIYAAHLDPAAGWGAPVLAETTDPPGVDADRARVGMDGAGNAVAAWYWGGNVVTNRFAAGAGWGTDTIVSVGPFSSNDHELAVGPGGEAVAIWYKTDGARFGIWSARFTPGGGWEAPPVNVDPLGAGAASAPHVGVDAAGNAIAVWHELAGGRYSVWSARLTPVGGWGAPVLVETEDAAHASEPRIAVDAAGNAVALWRQSTAAGPYDLWANRWTPGVGWGTPELVEAGSGTIGARSFAVALRGGVAMAVWEQASGGRTSIWSNRSPAGGGWSGPMLVETDDTGDAWSPRIALDAAGGAFAAWEQQRGSLYDILSSRFR